MNSQAPLIKAFQAQPVSDNDYPLPALSCEIQSAKLVVLSGLHHSLSLPYMKMLSALEAPTSGQISILGHENYEQLIRNEKQLRQKLGFVLQGGPLLSVINGIENLKLAARYHQIGDEEFIQQKAADILSEIPQQTDHMKLPAYMSRLLRRHLAIARPLMLDPQILFIDNPFEGLSYYDKDVIGKYLANIVKKRHITLLVSSDDLIFTRLFADQIIYCDNEEILVFEDWKHFIGCQQPSMTTFFKLQHMSRNV